MPLTDLALDELHDYRPEVAETYYYRRLFTDGVRLVDAVAQLEGLDPHRIAVTGGSQGGASPWRSPGSRRTCVRSCRTCRSSRTSAARLS